MPTRSCLRLTQNSLTPCAVAHRWRHNSRYAALALLASASCQAVFSSELTNDSSTDASTADSQSPTTVTIEFTALHVPNDSAGAPLPTRIPAALQGVDLAVSFDNGATTIKPMIDTTTGVVRFERPTPTTPYLLLVNTGARQSIAGMYGTAAQGYESLYLASRRGAEPTTIGSTRMVNLPPLASMEITKVLFSTTGVTTETDTQGSTQLLWANVQGPGNNVWPSAEAGDRCYVNGFSGSATAYTIAHSAMEPCTLTRDNFSFRTQLQPTQATPIKLHTPLQSLSGSLAGAQTLGGYPTAEWRILAAPQSPDSGGFATPPTGPRIAFAPPSNPADSVINLPLSNPFVGTKPIVKLRAQRDYGYRARETPMGNSNLLVYLPSFAEVYTPIDAESGAHLFASFARNISVNGNQVNVSDAKPYVNGPLTIAWRGLINESADAFAVTLIKLVSTGGPTTAVEMGTFRTTANELTIPAAVVTPGEYVLAVETWRGLPEAAQGDFRPQTLPAARTRVLTSIFTVE